MARDGDTRPDHAQGGWSTAEHRAMGLALQVAADLRLSLRENPRVGCVLLDSAGQVLATGVHRGPGTPHAEVDALNQVSVGREIARSEIDCAVVTLEPCNHTGRTGPCSEALIAAGVRRVVHAVADPNPIAAGGAAALAAAGVEVVAGCRSREAQELDEAWFRSLELGRPHVTWKVATTLDGRVAARDGTSRWISSPTSREHAHRLRAASDCVIVGTGTVLADDPALTVRGMSAAQPVRVVVGSRPIPSEARVRDGAAPLIHLTETDPRQVLSRLWADGFRRVLLEGGPTLAGGFMAAKVVDRVVTYQAPTLLGAGPAGLGEAGIGTIGDAARLRITSVSRLGPDVMIDAQVEGAR